VGSEISTKTTVGISLVLGETTLSSTTDVIVSGHAIESNVPHGTRFGFGISGIDMDMDMENPSNLGGVSLMLLLVALKLYRRLNVKSS
jgi:hypothetical protein